MLSKKIEAAFCKQLNAELYSAYLYLGMAAGLEANNLLGSAGWLKVQAKEEVGHAMRFYKYLFERGGKVTLSSIAAPEGKWDCPVKVFEAVVKHEAEVTAMINGLMDQAIKENDHAAVVFLQWFVNEQVEEEASPTAILARLNMAGDSMGALLMLDKELGKRE